MISEKLKELLIKVAVEGATEESFKNAKQMDKMINFILDQDDLDPEEASIDLIEKANKLGLEDFELVLCIFTAIRLDATLELQEEEE